MYSTTGIDASNFVSTFNTSFYLIAGISLLLLTGLTFTMLYFVFRYNKKKNKTAIQNEGNLPLEIVWTVVPVILALTMFFYGWKGWKPTTQAPKDAMNVVCIARMWNFMFLYENGKQSPDLIVPLNTPVKIKLTSLDVIHSLYIPDFRIKSDIVPGREKYMWFLPQTEGEFKIYCAEYCGVQHSYMHSKVTVLPKDKFDHWYIDTTKVITTTGTGPGAVGEAIMKSQGCFACHTPDGTKLIGPSYLNLFGSQMVVIKDGKEMTVKADEAYIKQCIIDPNYQVVKGFQKGLMQSYRNSLSDNDIEKIIVYLKSLHD
ncbi:MAG TPA: cytochrome c oxidase subunit II [Bacteroidales bacterium]